MNGLSIKRAHLVYVELFYFLVVGGLIYSLCIVPKFSFTIKLFLGLFLLLGACLVGNIFKNIAYLSLFSLAAAFPLFKNIPLVGTYAMEIGVSDLFIMLLFLLLVGYTFSQAEIRFKKNFLLMPLLLLFFSAILSLSRSADKRLSILFLLIMFGGFILYSYILLFFKSENDLRRLLFIFFIIAFFYGVYGFFQFKLGYLPLIGGHELEKSLGVWGNRVRANLAHPNSLSGFIVVVLPLMWVSFSKGRILWNLWLCFSILLLIFTLSVTYSRNGYIAFLISTFFLAILYSKKYRKPKIFLLFFLGMFILALGVFKYAPSIFARFMSTLYFRYDPAALGRLNFWKESLKGFAHNPFIGIGVSNFVHQPYSLGFLGPHNLYIATLLEMGILGGIGLFTLIYRIFRRLINIYKIEEPEFIVKLSIGLLASWIAFLIHNFFDSIWGVLSHPSEIKYLWFFLSITVLTVHLSNKKKHEEIFKR